ncbi:MAG: HTH domain-containing protein [Bacillota bacterium]|nr:HTH domain-containing protein [Bacillota bacterium]
MDGNIILEKIRQMNRAFLRSDEQLLTMDEAATIIAEVIGSDVLVVERDGKVLGSGLPTAGNNNFFEPLVKEGFLPEGSALMGLVKACEPLVDKPFKEKSGSKKNFTLSMIPLLSKGRCLATLLLGYSEKELDKEKLVVGEAGSALIGMMILHKVIDQNEEDTRNRELAEVAFESLSYSEVEAIREILKNLENNESVVVASKIADSLGITRSVIVNALRKFESAGIIESRSLGMKGTFIRVKNTHALELVAARSERFGAAFR